MMEEGRFDPLLLNIAQQCQGIDDLLEVFLSFLRRKTDFYTGATADKVEDTVRYAVQKQMALADRTKQEQRHVREAEEKRRQERLRAAKLKEAEEQEARKKKAATAAAAAAAPSSSSSSAAAVVEVGSDGAFDVSSAAAAAPIAKKKEGGNPENVEEGEEGEDKEAPPGNGGATEHYVWTQQLAEVTVNVSVPPGTRSRDLVVEIGKKRLRVGLKGQPPMVEGELHKPVKVDDSFWTLEDGREVVVNLQKENGMEWWKCVVAGDPEIDTSKVNPENSKLSDLDAETRQTVEKMMFDQRQKQMGLPTSEELKKREMLEKFMKQHPEMDFSGASIK